MSRTSRSPVFLSEPVHKQLNMYALAEGAAGVSLLAMVQPAEGKIVYTQTHHVIYGVGSYIDLDLNHDGLPDSYKPIITLNAVVCVRL